MGEGQTGEGGSRGSERVLTALRAQIADGTYPVGAFLPPQRELAKEFGVARDTVQRALKRLVEDGVIESRQGSGSRVLLGASAPRQGRASSLRVFFAAAFERPQVNLDVYTLTSESLSAHVVVQAERIRAGEIAPERIALRMVLPSEEVFLPYPRTKGDPADPRLQDRLRVITESHTSALRRTLQELERDDLVTTEVKIRYAPLVPLFKLYLLNGTEALFAPYEVIERTIPLDGGEEIEANDVLGFGATLTHHTKDTDPESQEPAFVESMQRWFDSVWDRLTVEGS
ncbi:GntR family transcriptional regulator [Streptomyces phyllanthi]|uniref:GntR family transcriptional regulator n=1 Tax=Streptomyces phyllanthi TaxID=1803180 RepID=A0A5N8W0G1_9ACTN|nr:GntR family transcriptional regulator [Streptomyces phyllanthi]MPY40436.1 GntR family transcriptional regulator [Streptomyces phyllanthi]